MSLLIILGILFLVVGYVVWKGLKDVGDEEVAPPAQTPAPAPKQENEVVVAVKETLDVNKDGKVDIKDVKAAGEKVAKKVTRKPRAKKVS